MKERKEKLKIHSEKKRRKGKKESEKSDLWMHWAISSHIRKHKDENDFKKFIIPYSDAEEKESCEVVIENWTKNCILKRMYVLYNDKHTSIYIKHIFV